MKMLKKIAACTAALILAVSGAAAEIDLSGYSITNAVVSAVRFVDITAPFSGTLKSFDLNAGDAVQQDDVLFSMLTTDLYAQEDGVVSALFVSVGDDASAVMAKYGSVGAIDPDASMRISCTTTGAYNDEENKILHVGEKLYFESTKSGKEKGEGRVIGVSGAAYSVEILSGTFDMNETLTMYRNSSRSATSNVGKGTVVKRDPVMLTGLGIVTDIAVTEGQRVAAGDRLMSFVSTDAPRNAQPGIKAPEAGVVATVAVAAGQQVWKGQLLCRLYLTDELEITADVDEMDLHSIRQGSAVYITLDTDQTAVLTGKVTEISSLGLTKQNAAYFTVHVSIDATEDIRIGQSANLYLPKD